MIVRVGPWRYIRVADNYHPDRGEIIWARRTPVDRYLRAVVKTKWKQRDGFTKIHVVWLESDPDADPPVVVAKDDFMVLGRFPLTKRWDRPDPGE